MASCVLMLSARIIREDEFKAVGAQGKIDAVHHSLSDVAASAIARHLRLTGGGRVCGWVPPLRCSSNERRVHQSARDPAIVFNWRRSGEGADAMGITGTPLRHLSSSPEHVEILIPPFAVLKAQGRQLAAEGRLQGRVMKRLIVTAGFADCLLFSPPHAAFLEWARRQRDAAEARLAASAQPQASSSDAAGGHAAA
eukprot:gene14085-5735_t